MFTLALGVVALAVFEKLKKDSTLCICTILFIAWFATWSGVDYEWRGISAIVIFHLLGTSMTPFPFGRTAQLLCAFPLMMHYGIIGAMLACMVIFLYDGTRGFIQGKFWKYSFYIFYPLHLVIIKLLYEFIC